jgi:SAM-dependent methyltransferase
MMIYGEEYANQYDQLYGDKDYQGECDLVEASLYRFGTEKTHTVLDFGCGTGNHSIPLAERGYSLTGIDLSGEMLRVAQRKSTAAGKEITWIKGDIRNVQFNGVFDAGFYMFAVLGYMLQNNDMMSTLKNARQHIRKDGLLLFDVWYGPAVLAIRPSDKVKIIPTAHGKVLRTVTSKLDVRHHLCEVLYHLWELNGDRVESESEELHVVRYFFPLELELMLSQSGFELASLTAFPTLDRPADETTWNVFGVAHAR